MGAVPMGNPGWPELDLLIASTAKKRMLLMQRLSTEVVVATTMAERGKGGEGAWKRRTSDATGRDPRRGFAQVKRRKARQTL